jgi:thiamine-phosphate pyrophosphorylase
MGSALARSKLARAARALNRAAGVQARLPSLIFMTEETRVTDPVSVAANLPKGTAIILRHRDDARRAELAERLAEISRRRGLRLIIAGDPRLAIHVRAAGVHFSEARIEDAAHWRALRPSWLITTAAHSERAVLRAANIRADAALLAPVFPTKSHPDARIIGSLRLRLIASRAALPLYALGGIGAANVARLTGARLAGIAAIEGLLSAPRS